MGTIFRQTVSPGWFLLSGRQRRAVSPWRMVGRCWSDMELGWDWGLHHQNLWVRNPIGWGHRLKSSISKSTMTPHGSRGSRHGRTAPDRDAGASGPSWDGIDFHIFYMILWFVEPVATSAAYDFAPSPRTFRNSVIEAEDAGSKLGQGLFKASWRSARWCWAQFLMNFLNQPISSEIAISQSVNQWISQSSPSTTTATATTTTTGSSFNQSVPISSMIFFIHSKQDLSEMYWIYSCQAPWGHFL